MLNEYAFFNSLTRKNTLLIFILNSSKLPRNRKLLNAQSVTRVRQQLHSWQDGYRLLAALLLVVMLSEVYNNLIWLHRKACEGSLLNE